MTQKATFLNWGKIYSPNEITEVLQKFVIPAETVKTNKKTVYYNIPCAFDTETSSFFRLTGNGEEKTAIMYEWTLGLNGAVIIGRTWAEFLAVCSTIVTTLGLCKDMRLLIYVHNLAFDFQFMRKWFKWEKVFSLDTRKPLYALTDTGLEFRCSYLLSGYNLAKLGDQLHKYPVQKMVGDLNYSLIRHSGTPLSEKELKYCENDVRVVMAYIQERIEADGDITRIPLTKTGYVRIFCRNRCMYEGNHKKNPGKYKRYHKLMQSMKISPEEYEQLKRAFQGGFTHASAWKSGKTYRNVRSYDFTSSYPAVMISEKFPMSRAEEVTITSTQQFYSNIRKYCCLFDCTIEGLESKTYIEHPLSSSRCYKTEKVLEDNGRVVSAGKLCTTLTEQDFLILRKFYTWESFKVGNFRRYQRGYLPTDLVKAILELYQKKTTLKGVEGMEQEYMSSKENVNAAYGMMVTDICRPEIPYGQDWEMPIKPDIEKALEKYNTSARRFLFFPWGVWVTAYARRNLFTGIYACGSDYIYSDTDSVKILNAEKHQKYFEEYNNRIIMKLDKAMDFHGLPHESYKPKTIKGKEKILGVWDDEGEYTRFKTLGAKRYMTEKDGKISITVSGLNKKICTPYLVKKYPDPFQAFQDDLYIPSEYTGKNTHTYIDEEMSGTVVDYLGNTAEYHELSGVHLSPADHTLSLSKMYTDYLAGIRTIEK